jgi:peptidoglycan/LPS O-acetylase OafA/YrhL
MGRPEQAIGRYRSLDALRGLAALVVVLHHLALAVPGAYDLL